MSLDPSPPTEPDPAQHRLIEAPRFTLRTMLLGVAALSGVFAVLSSVGAIYAVLLVWLLLLVAAHVVANAWGMRLRGSRGPGDADDRAHLHAPTGAATVHAALAPTTRLGASAGIDRYMIAATLLGATIGGIAGGTMLAELYWQTASLAAILFGAFSAAVLGGFLGFLVSSFLGVTLRALREAAEEPRQ